jgi:hypothetical protein
VKFTRNLGTRSAVYAYYGRFFTPFFFENVSPVAAQQLNLPLQRSVAAFDLKPQRDSVYEIGGHLPLERFYFLDRRVKARLWVQPPSHLIFENAL